MNDLFKDMQAKIGCEYISDLPSYKRKVWNEMKRLNPADYEARQLDVWKDGLLVRLLLAVLLVRWQVARFQTENRQGTQLQKTVGAIPLPAWDSVQVQRWGLS